MALELVRAQDALRRLERLASGTIDSLECLADLIRTEIHARKHAPRAATISRVARLLAPALRVSEAQLDEAGDALEREGDVMLAPGGILYATPLRLVPLRVHARVFGSLPTRPLARALACEVKAMGAARMVATTEDLTNAVTAIGGVCVTPNIWAGLDRTPSADAEFMAKLDQRLEWESMRAGALEHEGPLEWRTWEVTPAGARWRSAAQGRVWWARARFGGHHRAWTAGASPATSPFIDLSLDDADRARFALSRGVPGAAMLRVERASERVTLEVPGWLPRPEYRWLSLHASPVPANQGIRWECEADDAAQIIQLLVDRLGLVVADR